MLLMLLMSTTAPLYFRVTVERVHGVKVNVYGACDIHEDGAAGTKTYLFLTLSAQLSLLIYANVLCYQARKIPTQYAETKYVAFACANHLQTKLFALLAAAFTYDEPQVTFLVKWLALTVSDFGTLCLIFVPKIWMKHHDGSAVMADAKDKLRDVAVDVWAKKAEKDELAAERSEKAAIARQERKERKERSTNGKSESSKSDNGERRTRYTGKSDNGERRSRHTRGTDKSATGGASINGRSINELSIDELSIDLESGTETPLESGTELDEGSDTDSVVVALSDEHPATEVRVPYAQEPNAPPTPQARPPVAIESERCSGGFWGRARGAVGPGRTTVPTARGTA